MGKSTNHFRLGLFVIVGIAAAIFAAVLFGKARFHEDVVQYHTYFNESVQGLELGAPVKFRGVTVGHVVGIEIAPDQRMVDVSSELNATDVKRMGLRHSGSERRDDGFSVPPDLRMQLNSQGITAIKFVAIDFFDINSNPPPSLPFQPPRHHYIPAAPSMMKNLEDSVTKAMDRLPEMVDAVVVIMARIDALFAELAAQNVSGKVASALDRADTTIRKLDTFATRLNERDLAGKAADTLEAMSSAAGKLDAVLDELSGSNGLIPTARRATEAFRDLGANGRDTQRDLSATLRSVSEAAEAIRTLAESIERDPDMLLKGKAERRERR